MTVALSPPTRGTSRRLLVVAVVSLLAAVLAACGGGNTAAPPEQAGAGFPVTLPHKFGSTDITAAPARVVTVGLTDQDAVLALGVRPVGVIDWYGDYPNAVWPWQQQAFGDTPPSIVGDSSTINFEESPGCNRT